MHPAYLFVLLSCLSIPILSFAGLGDAPSGTRKMGDGATGLGGSGTFGSSTIQTPADPNAKIKGTWPTSVYTMDRLKEAQDEAYNTGKAVAIIHTRIEENANTVEISLDVEKAIRSTCVTVYAHSHDDDSKLPRLAFDALDRGEVGPYIPKTIVMNPNLQDIITTIHYVGERKDRGPAYSEANRKITEYLATKMPSVRPGPQTNSVICVRAIDAFNPANPTQILGKFQPGSLLIIESTNLVQGLMPVKFTPPQGPAVPALCQPAALAVGN
jgi:hypothetical protein